MSAVSRHAEVRDAMLAVQRATALRGDMTYQPPQPQPEQEKGRS